MHSGPAIVTGLRSVRAARIADPDQAMLLSDQRGPEDVVDPAVDDRDLPAPDRLPVEDPGDVGAGRTDQEPPRLDQDRASRQRAGRPPARRSSVDQPPAQAGEVERGFPVARRGSRVRHRRRPGAARSPSSAMIVRPNSIVARACVDQGRGVAHVRRAERMEPEQLELRRAARGRGAGSAASASSIPNLPAPSSPTIRTRFEARVRPPTAAAAGPVRAGRRGGDPLEPGQLARRLDRDGPDAGRDRGASSLSRLPGPVNHDPVAGRTPPGGRAASSPPDATSAPSPSRPGGRRPPATGSP